MPAAIKALFFDLDGTLLTSDKTILPSAQEALRRARERGVRVFLATGRSPRVDKMLGWTEEECALFDGGVFSNGACTVLGGQTEYALIDPRAVRAMLEETARHPQVHLSISGAENAHWFNYTLPDAALSPWGLTREEVRPVDGEAIHNAVKVLIFHDDLINSVTPLPAGLYERICARCGDTARLYLTDQGRTIQAAGRDVSKRAGVERIRTALGLAAEEIAVFGDDLNDLEMITAYPVSIAMGNAAPEVKAAAAHVTLTNDEDGIARALSALGVI